MIDSKELYYRLPVPVQHLAATAYGARQFTLRYRGSFRREVDALDRRQWWSAEQLAADQDERVRRLVHHCWAHVAHYRELFRDLGLHPADVRTSVDLAALPLLEKEAVRGEPERFHSRPTARGLIEQTTGGTTGTPLRYVASRDAVRFNYATYEARTRRWAGVERGDRIATFQGQPIVPPDARKPPFWRRNLAFNQLYFSVYHLTDDALPAYVRALEHFAPRAVVGYPSAIHRIARHLIERGDVGRISPVAVLVSSETLFPAVRRDLETAFATRVHDAYSLGELVAYASECPRGAMHVSTEYGVVELVEHHGVTEIVATGLNNLAMPFLRYRTGDTAHAGATTCDCGRGLPVITGIAGRLDDAVVTPEGARVGPAPMSLAFQTVPNLKRAQVHQSSPAGARVLCEVASGFDAADQTVLERELRRRLGASIEIEIEIVDAIARTAGGKERLVVSTVGRSTS